MLSSVETAYRRYNDFILNDENADPRSKHLFLVSSPITVVVILVSYLYFCTKCGPRWMTGRPPFELKNTLIIYNVLQILLSFYIAIEGTTVFLQFSSWVCEARDYSRGPYQMKVVNVCWLYFISKIIELLDTVFFVLRKKNNQISSLHLFHHTVMVLTTGFGTRYSPTGHSILFGVINSYVHMVMYTYYLIAGLGPEYQKYLWWKKYLTTIQLIQFVIIFAQNLITLTTGCDYPLYIPIGQLSVAIAFIYLFGKFYYNTYIENKVDKRQ